MKKLVIILVILTLTFALVACKRIDQALDNEDDSSPVTEGAVPDVVEATSPDAVTLLDAPETTTPAFMFNLENIPLIDGSTATIPLIEAVYSVLLGVPRDQAAQMVSTSGTDSAYDNLIWGDAGILLVYSPSPHVLENAKNNGIELEMAPIGRDGLVFLVNNVNPVKSLTPEEIVSIYSGEITNWKAAGGEDVEIKAFQRPDRSGSQTMMDELVMKGIPMAQTEAEYVIGEMGGLIDAVALYDNAQSAIGYNVYYFVSKMEINENVRMLAVGGVEPSTESISDGSYPLVSDFYAVIKKDTPPDSPARILYDWIQSADGQNLIKHEGYATAG